MPIDPKLKQSHDSSESDEDNFIDDRDVEDSYDENAEDDYDDDYIEYIG